ncbi:hypothetical protein D4R71_07135 [bacterium]|nr:MAG: hypothetical protein D4R71_07135 [bacterium]
MALDILNNRELALTIWIIVFIIFSLLWLKMEEVRKSFKRLLKAFFVKKIISSLVLMVIYIVIVVIVLYKLNLWEFHQLKNTIFWSVSIGAMNLLRISAVKKDPQFFKNSILDNLKLIAFIQLITGYYTFNLFVELLLVPFILILSLTSIIAKRERKLQGLGKFIDKIMALFGLILILYSTYMLIAHLSEFTTKQTMCDFYTPPLLTLLYFPFIYIMIIFITYEEVFIRMQFFIKNVKLRRYAKLCLIFNFKLRIKLIDRWASTLQFQDNSSREEIKASVKQIFKMVSVEKNPPAVLIKEGWSPYLAKQFLESEGLQTGYYHPISQKEWFACSNSIKCNNDLICNDIIYYVDGNETIARSLELVMSIYSVKSALVAHNKLLSCTRTLLKNALDVEISGNIEKAILNGENQTFKFGQYVAEIVKEDFQLRDSYGYHIKFTLSKID